MEYREGDPPDRKWDSPTAWRKFQVSSAPGSTSLRRKGRPFRLNGFPVNASLAR